jgi:Mannose-6-phosphate isomerase
VLTSVVGAKDLVVVASRDAVLVVPHERAEAVKELVTVLKKAARPRRPITAGSIGRGGTTNR